MPSPPKTSPYWDRHFQILGPRQWLWVPCDVRPAEDRGRESQKRDKTESSHPRYSESAPLIPRPHGWQSHTPAVSHVHIARCTRSEATGISGLSRGFTRRPTGAFWQERQSRRSLSRITAGAGGLIAQFWRSEIYVSCKLVEAGGSRETELTLHTTVLHLRHWETMSRAQLPALPL